MVERENLSDRIEIDSAGTAAYHVGEAPDPRACEAALRRGVDLSALRGRQAERVHVGDQREQRRHLLRLPQAVISDMARRFSKITGAVVEPILRARSCRSNHWKRRPRGSQSSKRK